MPRPAKPAERRSFPSPCPLPAKRGRGVAGAQRGASARLSARVNRPGVLGSRVNGETETAIDAAALCSGAVFVDLALTETELARLLTCSERCDDSNGEQRALHG